MSLRSEVRIFLVENFKKSTILFIFGEWMLSDIDLYLLDVIVNLEPLHKHILYEFWLTKSKKLTEEEINESINKLLSSGYISVKKDEYDWEIVTINSDKKDEVSRRARNRHLTSAKSF